MDNIDNLTHFQYAALEGEVAFALATSPHDAEMKYRIYMLLASMPLELYPYVISAVKNAVTFDETEIDRLVLEVENHTVPVWLWIERTIADLKMACSSSESQYYTYEKLSVNKKEAKRAVVRSAFVMFIRSVALSHSLSAKNLCYAVMEENDLKFLHGTCFCLIQDIEELELKFPPKEEVNPELLNSSFDPKEIMSFYMEKEKAEELAQVFRDPTIKPTILDKNTRKTPRQEEQEDEVINEITNSGEFSSEEISQFISEQLEGLFTGQIPKPKAKVKKSPEKTVVFKVQKTFNGSHLSTTLKVFKTREEAIDFVETIEKEFPELKETCKIEIFKEIVK